MSHLICRCDRGVAADVRLAVRRLARWLRETQPIQHRVAIRVVPAEVAVFTKYRFPDRPFYGAFLRPLAAPNKHRDLVRIFVAGRMASAFQRRHGYTRKQGVLVVCYTLLHEFAHYEEWRDRKRPSEKRANARAVALLHDAFGVVPLVKREA